MQKMQKVAVCKKGWEQNNIAQQCFLLPGLPRLRKGSAIPHFEKNHTLPQDSITIFRY